MLAIGVSAVLVTAVPGAAAANWTHNGEELNANAHLLLTGQVAFQGSLGKLSCEQATLTLELTAGTSKGHLKTFAADSPKTKCKVTSGWMYEACGGKQDVLAGMQLAKQATAAIQGDNIGLTFIELTFTFENACFGFTLKNQVSAQGTMEPLVLTPDNPEAISSVTLSGPLTGGAGIGMSVLGTLSATPAGTYGTTP